ncbi:MAG: leucyl aminopeptidase [Acidobacteria bacterium]|nr:MAG: leucyl aminopeptidase [Acidobacteriota bacterium]
MSRTLQSSAVRLIAAPPAQVDVDLLVVPLFEGEPIAESLNGLDSATSGEASRAVTSGELKGRPYDFFFTPVTSEWKARRIALVGAGRASELTLDRLRKLAAAAAMQARQKCIDRVAFLERGGLDGPGAVQAIADGLTLSAFSADQYKSGERLGPPPAEFTVVVPAERGTSIRELGDAVERGCVLAESCNIAKALSNEPSNVLTPREFADRAARIGRDAGLAVDILDEHQIARLDMGLLLGVARGSAEPPRVIVLRHEPSGAPSSPVLGLVGKGITFDTGGISIKPADGMERMKDDMAGGAAVICAMRAIALLRAPIKVVGVVPATENMPGGKAVKPGDVLKGASGKTVEVINTDAEGRLVLGDGLWYAQQLGATHLIDVATLTGACAVALGRAASGLFGAPEDWVQFVRETADRSGDRCWPMPLFEEYADQLRSEIADMVNSGGRPAGACTAAMFLKEFTGGLPWAHFDIAGVAWADETKPYQPKGATGVAVRALAELAFALKP